MGPRKGVLFTPHVYVQQDRELVRGRCENGGGLAVLTPSELALRSHGPSTACLHLLLSCKYCHLNKIGDMLNYLEDQRAT